VDENQALRPRPLRYNRLMQYVRQAGTDPAFLLKALSEVSGEVRQALYGFRRSELLEPADFPDDGWSLMAIARHMRDVERGVLDQVSQILNRREPEIPNVDMDDIPVRDELEDDDEDELLEEFHYLRRHHCYLLWDMSERDWERSGTHPYRGRVTIIQLVRELYQHDLEHLWQVRRMAEAMPRAAR
jgi:hypothetical protein